MKPFLLCLFLAGLLASPCAFAADEKIDPETYICAEIIASAVDGAPPIFEALQLDGFAAAKAGQTAADPNGLEALLLMVSDSCSAKPEEKALQHWQTARKNIPWQENDAWKADKTTCGDYQANTDDGSGFVIWLDGYQRARTGKRESVFTNQETLDRFLEQCAANPQRLMYDVMVENAR